MLESALYLRDSSNVNTDPASDILHFTKAQTLVTGGFSAGGSWSLQFPVPKSIKFFAIVRGRCWVRIDGVAEPVAFGPGDVGLLAAPRAFVLASDLSIAPQDAMEVFGPARKTDVAIGEGDDFEHMGGHVLLDPVSGRFLADVLPPWIHVPADRPDAAIFRWLLEQLQAEKRSTAFGSQLASSQLAQLLFIHILRTHLATADTLPTGWLRALSDARLAAALRLMHAAPERAWSLDELAQASSMSRTSFAVRFKELAGITPLAYLTAWRMRLAERALREELSPVATIGASLGYSSESAFSNAFKREVGVSPQRYRRNAMPVSSDPAETLATGG
jgi:AraC-like DNA-binding protein